MSYNLHVSIRKVLIANRGEIAVRLLRGLREMEITTVAIYTPIDRDSLHVRMADYAIASPSYLDIDAILRIAVEQGADALHPGYGFLSENADFAAACETAGVIFIGPSSKSIARLGSKTEARKLAASAGAPVVPGNSDSVSDPHIARSIAAEVGYPVMIKASAGGGGKGMRRVDSEQDLDAALRDAASEAERSFSSATVYIEKLIENPRHIEIQILGDRHGHMIHLGERECSLQRRHQKVIEECPSPLMRNNPELRQRMGEAAIRVAQAAGYFNAGTVEFLVDSQQNFFFLEMNTRLQVEHPVTELVTGLDLVQWQIKIAEGQPLTMQQSDVRWSGHSIECRLYAEDPENNFLPSPGLITALTLPSGPGVRVDSGITAGRTVPIDYDPLLAKVVVHARTRDLARMRMLRAMDETHIGGIRTNTSFFRQIMSDPTFASGDLHTGFIEEFFRRRPAPSNDELREKIAALVTAAAFRNTLHMPRHQSASKWMTSGRFEALR